MQTRPTAVPVPIFTHADPRWTTCPASRLYPPRRDGDRPPCILTEFDSHTGTSSHATRPSEPDRLPSREVRPPTAPAGSTLVGTPVSVTRLTLPHSLYPVPVTRPHTHVPVQPSQGSGRGTSGKRDSRGGRSRRGTVCDLSRLRTPTHRCQKTFMMIPVMNLLIVCFS